jgi:hypothetical protein
VKRSQGHPSATTVDTPLPSLPLESWAATKDTLHLWIQVVGKIKLAYMPPKNHWWHVTFHLDLSGLTTGRIQSMRRRGWRYASISSTTS